MVSMVSYTNDYSVQCSINYTANKLFWKSKKYFSQIYKFSHQNHRFLPIAPLLTATRAAYFKQSQSLKTWKYSELQMLSTSVFKTWYTEISLSKKWKGKVDSMLGVEIITIARHGALQHYHMPNITIYRS